MSGKRINATNANGQHRANSRNQRMTAINVFIWKISKGCTKMRPAKKCPPEAPEGGVEAAKCSKRFSPWWCVIIGEQAGSNPLLLTRKNN